MTSTHIMALGLAAALAGLALPFLMVLHVLEADFFLSFMAHVASLVGLPLAFYGAFRHFGSARRSD
jgi:hypothetical protein